MGIQNLWDSMKNSPLAVKVAKSPKVVEEFRRLYNTLCRECQIKVNKNPKMDVSEYCPACQNRVQYRLERIKEMMKG